MAKILTPEIPIGNNENDRNISFLDTVRTTTKDIEVIASRIAVRKLLGLGWEVADLNNLVPFFSIGCVGGDILERYSRMGPLNFLKGELTDAPYSGRPRENPRLLFYHFDRRYDAYERKTDNTQLRMRYTKIPRELAGLILKILSKRSKFLPIDYLVLNPEGYLFVELKANKSHLSKKQLEVSNMIQDAGYKVAEFHVSLSLGLKAEVRCGEVRVVKG
ncbi:MAG: hypothetical protein HW414_1043 [Dehalococcoidia bacterium]|nr:hypothetical protein [Dehalococcoidia bacterium]